MAERKRTANAPADPALPVIGDGRVRAVVDAVLPAVDGGRFAAKRIAGEPVMVDRFLPDFGFAQATPDWLLFRRGYPRKGP